MWLSTIYRGFSISKGEIFVMRAFLALRRIVSLHGMRNDCFILSLKPLYNALQS